MSEDIPPMPGSPRLPTITPITPESSKRSMLKAKPPSTPVSGSKSVRRTLFKPSSVPPSSSCSSSPLPTPSLLATVPTLAMPEDPPRRYPGPTSLSSSLSSPRLHTPPASSPIKGWISPLKSRGRVRRQSLSKTRTTPSRSRSRSRSRSISPSRSPTASRSPSPSPSPTKRLGRMGVRYSDRYIPNREGVDLGAAHKLMMLQDNDYFSPSNANINDSNNNNNDNDNDDNHTNDDNGLGTTIPGGPILNVEQQQTWEANRTFNTLLRAELFADKVPRAAIVEEYNSYTPPPSMRSMGHGGSNSGSNRGSLNVDYINNNIITTTSPTRTGTGTGMMGAGAGGSRLLSANGMPILASPSASSSSSSLLSLSARPRTPPPGVLASSSSTSSSYSGEGAGAAGIRNLFSFKSPTRRKPLDSSFSPTSKRDRKETTAGVSSPKGKEKEKEKDNNYNKDKNEYDFDKMIYSNSVVRPDSQRLLLSPRKPPRTVSNVPYKVLDAPELADDFYLNLVDWGQNNILAVGLGSMVYLWNGLSGQVTKLCDVNSGLSRGDEQQQQHGGTTAAPDLPSSSGYLDRVTSVAWIEHAGNHLAVGCDSGLVQIWDCVLLKRVRTMPGHTARVGCLAWRDHILSSGSRDRHIVHRDVRAPVAQVAKWLAHHQEVCGLEWSPAHLASRPMLASGGNDNRLMVWEGLNINNSTTKRTNKDQSPRLIWEFADNKAAIKALAWHPYQRGILASGGGTADGRIRFWNTTSGKLINEIATGSQVCNLKWSKTSNELVSTHGYSKNHITIWKYPSLQPVATLTGHSYRVLYLSMSPDGQSIVTGAGDETLRFWQVFGKTRVSGGVLDAFSLR